MILYRPVGHRELELIYESGMRAFPPRLPDQPIFYPVLNTGYVREIAEGWNTKNGRLRVTSHGSASMAHMWSASSDAWSERYAAELWVPAEELAEFNGHLLGSVEVIAAYFGPGFVGAPFVGCGGESKTTAEAAFQELLATAGVDFGSTVATNHKSVYCNYAFWKRYDSERVQDQGGGRFRPSDRGSRGRQPVLVKTSRGFCRDISAGHLVARGMTSCFGRARNM